MASIKIKFRPSKIFGKEGVIYYQIIQERVIRQISTEYKIYTSEWDSENCRLIDSQSGRSRHRLLMNIRDRMKLDIERINCVISSLVKRGVTYTADDIVEIFEKRLNGPTMCSFTLDIISRHRELRKYRSVETYTTTLRSFLRFCEGKDLLLTDIDSDLMISYEAYLKYENVSMNTISFYLRTLRAIYNRALERGFVEECHPFKKVYTGVDKTVKRALPLRDIKCIKEMDLSFNMKLSYARDMFLFSFYTRGMSFVDMAYLRKKDIHGGVLTYRRRKTG